MELVKQFMSRSLISAEFSALHPPHPQPEPSLGHAAPGTVGTAGDSTRSGQPAQQRDRGGALREDAGSIRREKQIPDWWKIQQRSCLAMVTEKTPPGNVQSSSSPLCPCWISQWHFYTIPAPLPCSSNHTVTCTVVCPVSCSVPHCGWWHS